MVTNVEKITTYIFKIHHTYVTLFVPTKQNVKKSENKIIQKPSGQVNIK